MRIMSPCKPFPRLLIPGLMVILLSLMLISSASAEILNLPKSYPSLTFGPSTSSSPNTPGATIYTSGNTVFLESAYPTAIRKTATDTDHFINPTGSPSSETITISIRVSNDGQLIGGDGGHDLLVVGQVDLGNGLIAGTLLTGDIVQFGYYNATSGAIDLFDFRFKISGGLLAQPGGIFGPDQNGIRPDLYVRVTSENSTFSGNFNSDFAGEAKGNLWSTKTTALGDLVWADTNGNGIQDNGEVGLPDVPVQLKTCSGTPITTTTTDNNGKYLFSGLLPGSYQTFIIPPAQYIVSPLDQGGNDQTDSDTNPSTNLSPCVTLASGEQNLTVDAGLWQPASIGDSLWNDANNNGVQDLGELPLNGWTVNITGPNGYSNTATTANGLYAFTNLMPGAYTVCAVPMTGYIQTYDLDGLGTANCATVTLVAGQTNNDVDFGYLLPAAIGDYLWDDANNNGVQDLGELPLNGWTVNITGPNGYSNTATTANGLYAFTNLMPGAYTVCTVPMPGYTQTYDLDGLGSANCATVTVIANQTNNDVDFGYRQPAAIGDYLWNDTNNNGTQDAGELPLNDWTVNITGPNGYSNTATTANGLYSFSNLMPGSYTVCTVPMTGYIQTYDLDGLGTANCATVTLVAGQTNNDVDFGYRQPAAIGDKVWNDTNANGTQEAGEPGIPGATVELFTCDHVKVADDITDADGIYSFTNLAPGSYYVKVTLPSGMSYVFTTKGGGDGMPDDGDSDVDPMSGMTDCTILEPGENDPSWDAGAYIKISIGNYVWVDTNNNGIQDDGNTGKDGVLVKLLDCSGNVVATTITEDGGKYSFSIPVGGQYQVQFLLPADYIFSKANEGNDDAIDSDATQTSGIVPCATYMISTDTIDAGLVAIVPSIDIRKQAEGPDSRTVVNGSDVSFEIVVTNTGNAPLSNVEVTDALVPACAKVIGDLAPGASTNYTCTANNVTANFTNIAMVNGIHNGMNYTDNDESTVMVDTPSIEVNKLVSVDGGMTWLEANDINDCADAPQAGSCDGTSGSSCGPCDGKVSDLSLLYHGTKAAIVKITNRNGFTLYTQTVQPEGIIVLSLADSDGKLTPSIKIYVDGLLYTSLHTSCSQPIGPGLIVGNFEVVSGSSLNGGQLCSVSCAGTDPAPTCGTCNGKVSQLTLGYTGNSNAKVKIVNKDGYTLLLKDIVTPGEMLNFSLANGYGNLTTDIKIYLNGYYHTSIHTSCSQPIGPGLVFGNFQVISGASLNGGILCPYDSIVSTGDSKSCDGKITELEMVYNGNYEKSVLVKDKDGRELFKGSVKPGKSFKFSGKDNYGTCTSDVTVYVESRFHGTIKTDCSQDIGSGYKVGDFKVSTGKSSHGGKLSKISSNDYLYQNGQETCTYLPTAPPCTPDKVSYKFVVTNTGNTSLSNVTLSDTDHQACSVSSVLAAGEIDECIIGPFDSTPGLHTNTATATGDYITGAMAVTVSDTDNASYCGGINQLNPAIDIRKQAEGPDSRTVISGSDVSFEIVVTNTGTAPLTNVAVTDAQIPACTKTIGDLAPGISTSYTCIATNITANLTNIATVTGTYNSMNYTDSDESTVMVDSPSIEINKYVSLNGGSTWLDANGITDCADAPQINACDGTTGTNCASCDGKVSNLTLLYNGIQAAAVKITNKDGYTLFNQTVQPNGQISLALADGSGRLTPSIKLYVNGLFHTSIHTSCSVPIGPGLIAGNFTVVSGSSLNGGQLCAISYGGANPAPTCGTCNGKVSELTLGYTGSTAKVKIVNKDGYTLFEKSAITSGEMLTFSLANNYSNLTTEIKIYLNGSYHTLIHTSCSQPIGPGLVAGKFQVMSGTSLNGGILCAYDGNSITRDDKPCDGKITELEMVYRGRYEKTVQVKDKDGRELYKGSVKPEGKFKFSGKDSSDTCTSEISVYVDSRLNGTVKTDCSVDVGSGYKVGDFQVNFGKSSHGGKLSKVNSSDFSYQNGQESCTTVPPPPSCVPGQVSYKFVVTNTGNTALSQVLITDSTHPACTISNVLAAGEFDDCTIGPFNAKIGLQTNTATTTGKYINGATTVTVSDTDDASYCGGSTPAPINCGLSITKTVDKSTVTKAVFGDGSCFGDDGYDKDGYDKDGYDWDGYDRKGFGHDGYDEDGYNKDGFDRYDRCREGHSKSEHERYGHNSEGYDKDGYNRNGHNSSGYDRHGYDHQGYDKDGSDRKGYDRDGYDKSGFDRSGHCREGHSKDVHQQSGLNRYGYDLDGYNAEGRDKEGYDRQGCNQNGYDRNGYDKNGWNKDGRDRSGHSRTDHDGSGCSPSTDICPSDNLVTYTYTVNNTGNAVQSVMVTDDKLGYIGTINTLATNGTSVLKKSACIKDTTTNTATATVKSWQECSVSAQATVQAVCTDTGSNTCNWWDKTCYDKDGYNHDGYDRDSYDWDGYKSDYQRDRDGYDREGKDKNGYDRSGNYCGSSYYSYGGHSD